ncbi:GNAT family N-acetyltransferase [Paenibacillus sp. VCA1]|uniref:GNAT family N-acetyltransferase n=1 Tax=Paenibacillus sp. VCA1 TaxID=3039148 RepID=UPI0028719894|nr:GNAT family N-acetyltransferase [Paenibacillus sp. VCA1]MDR9856520.1 GNAT family N-acetyltransferase [Paenibacillus sp. VCA1]
MIQYSNGRITIFQSALFQTTSTVVHLDDFVLVVDPNWLPGEIREIKEHVAAVQGDKPCYLLFTHGDYDHIIGYKAFPGAKTIGSAGLAHHPHKERKLGLIRDFDAMYYVTRDYPVAFPELDIVIGEDGQQVTIGSTTLTFYLAPGHTEDGLFAVIDAEGVMIAGDYLSDFELPFIYHSAKAYEETINKAKQILRDHPVRLLIPGHGRYADDRAEMDRRVRVALDHLMRLKEAVLDGDEEALEQLKLEHGFLSETTMECHKENVRIMRKELSGGVVRQEGQTLNYAIRPISDQDIPFLWDMLYESLYVPEGGKPFGREILQDPAIAKYAEHWGRPGDIGWIAVTDDGQPMGTITARLFDESNRGYGYIGPDVPELGMAISQSYRGKGIGTALMKALFDELRKQGISRVSLSVDPNNEAAVKLYRRFGFIDVGVVDTSITMVADVKRTAYSFGGAKGEEDVENR